MKITYKDSRARPRSKNGLPSNVWVVFVYGENDYMEWTLMKKAYFSEEQAIEEVSRYYWDYETRIVHIDFNAADAMPF